MADINELLRACISVITEYHDIKITSGAKASEQLDLLMRQPIPEASAQLMKMIDVAVTARAGDEIRRPVFVYLLHQIELLRSFRDRLIPAEEAEVIAIKRQLTQFFVDLQSLLTLPASTAHIVHDQDKDVSISGLLNEGLMTMVWSSWRASHTATLLQGRLFPALGLVPESSRSEIERSVEQVLTNHRERQMMFHARESALLAREALVSAREAAVEQKEADVVKREEDLATKEAGFIRRDDSLKAKERDSQRRLSSDPQSFRSDSRGLVGAYTPTLFQMSPLLPPPLVRKGPMTGFLQSVVAPGALLKPPPVPQDSPRSPFSDSGSSAATPTHW